MKAIRGKSLEILKALARLNPDAVNTGDKNSATPIHHAVVYQNVEAIRVLVGAGGDLQSKDKNNETPLDLAKKLVRRGTHKDNSVVEALESMVVS
jgi:ankyrin repeat protein